MGVLATYGLGLMFLSGGRVRVDIQASVHEVCVCVRVYVCVVCVCLCVCVYIFPLSPACGFSQ